MIEESGTIELSKKEEVYQRFNTKQLIDWVSKYFDIKGKFLDVGCADGWTVKYLQEKFKTKGTGLTIDEKDVKRCNENKIKSVLADAENTKFKDETFDFIYCRHTLEHTNSPLLAIREFKRVVKKNGYIIVSVPEFCLKYVHCESHKYVMPSMCWTQLFLYEDLEIIGITNIVGFESEYCFIVRKKDDN